jgi:hypothetical protein
MADLEKFKDDLKSGGTDPSSPPSVISAGKLDRNFERCTPQSQDGNNVAYRVDSTDSGWRLLPTKTFDVCENGKATTYAFFAQRSTDATA